MISTTSVLVSFLQIPSKHSAHQEQNAIIVWYFYHSAALSHSHTMSWWSLLSKYIYWLFSHCIHHIDVYDLLRHFPKDHFQVVFSEHSFLWLFIIQVLEFMRLYKEFYYNIKQSWRSHLKNKSLQASFLLNTFPHREWLTVTWHHLLQHRENDGAQGTNQGILFTGHWLLWG